MALIELNLEKPALKRVESVKEKQVEEESIQAEVNPEEAREMTVETEVEETSESGGGSRIRKYGRRAAILGGTAAGVVAARRIRQRRKSKTQQQELEEDWQTAE